MSDTAHCCVEGALWRARAWYGRTHWHLISLGKDLQLEVKDACLPSPIMAEAEVLKNLSLDRGESCIRRHFLFESCSDHLAIFVVKSDATSVSFDCKSSFTNRDHCRIKQIILRCQSNSIHLMGLPYTRKNKTKHVIVLQIFPRTCVKR